MIFQRRAQVRFSGQKRQGGHGRWEMRSALRKDERIGPARSLWSAGGRWAGSRRSVRFIVSAAHIDVKRACRRRSALFAEALLDVVASEGLKEEGTLRKRAGKRPFKKIDPDKLRSYIQANPDAYLRETAMEFHCCKSAMSKALKRLKITRKKDQTLPGTRPSEGERIFGKDTGYSKRQDSLY